MSFFKDFFPLPHRLFAPFHRRSRIPALFLSLDTIPSEPCVVLKESTRDKTERRMRSYVSEVWGITHQLLIVVICVGERH